MINTRILILAGVFAASMPVFATAATSLNDGYLVDSANSIVKNGYGGCWHTIYWTPAMAVAGCDPVAKQEEKTQPKMSSMLPMQVQAKVPSQKITFSEEDLFKFNEATLRPMGKVKLDNLVHDLEGANYGAIHVVGFTDRIGSAAYNQRLSLRRADEVKGYLINKGIPADRIQTEGKGKTQPITKSSDCRGMTKAKEIACLQPDRRVEVTVDGTKIIGLDAPK